MFVAALAGDGGALDLLAGLPLAGGLHRARIAFGAEARSFSTQISAPKPDHRGLGRENEARTWGTILSRPPTTFFSRSGAAHSDSISTPPISGEA